MAVIVCIVLVALTERPTFTGLAAGLVGFLGFVLVALAALGRFWTSLFIARHGIPGLLLGNTAERIVNRVDCSILAVVPSPAEPNAITPG